MYKHELPLVIYIRFCIGIKKIYIILMIFGNMIYKCWQGGGRGRAITDFEISLIKFLFPSTVLEKEN